MNWLSCEVPKNSLMVAFTGRMLISDCGVMASASCVVMRSRTTRSIRLRPGAQLVLDQLADLANAAVAEVVDVVHVHAQLDVLAVAAAREGLVAGVQVTKVLDGGDDVLTAQAAVVVVRLQAELAVDLVAAHAPPDRTGLVLK